MVCEGLELVVDHGSLAGNLAGFVSGLCDDVAPFYPALQSLADIGTLEAFSSGGQEEVVVSGQLTVVNMPGCLMRVVCTAGKTSLSFPASLCTSCTALRFFFLGVSMASTAMPDTYPTPDPVCSIFHFPHGPLVVLLADTLGGARIAGARKKWRTFDFHTRANCSSRYVPYFKGSPPRTSM